mgnify:CR=1 FL=1
MRRFLLFRHSFHLFFRAHHQTVELFHTGTYRNQLTAYEQINGKINLPEDNQPTAAFPLNLETPGQA